MLLFSELAVHCDATVYCSVVSNCSRTYIKNINISLCIIATTTYSFVVWDFNNVIPRCNHFETQTNEDDQEKKEEEDVSYKIYIFWFKYNLLFCRFILSSE